MWEKGNNTGCISRHGYNGDTTQSKTWNKEYMHECGNNEDAAPNWFRSHTTMKVTQALGLMKTGNWSVRGVCIWTDSSWICLQAPECGRCWDFWLPRSWSCDWVSAGRDTHEILTFSINTDSQRGFAVSVLIYFIIFLTKQLSEGVFKGRTDHITKYEGLLGAGTYIVQ